MFVLLLKESSLNFPLNFKVYVEFHDKTLNVGDVIIAVTDTAGTIDLKVPLNFPAEEISNHDNFAAHPMLSKKNDI